MQVILLRDVDAVGLRGEVVEVARGYARNYLLPRKLAEAATPARIAEVERRDAQRARHEAQTFEQARDVADSLGQTVIRIETKAGPTGSLFGSVTATDVADQIWTARKVRVDRRKIGLDGPIKRVGRYHVPIELFQDVTVEIETHVVPEGGELPPEEELQAWAAEETAAVEEAEREQQQAREEAAELAEPEPEFDAASPADGTDSPPAGPTELEETPTDAPGERPDTSQETHN